MSGQLKLQSFFGYLGLQNGLLASGLLNLCANHEQTGQGATGEFDGK